MTKATHFSYLLIVTSVVCSSLVDSALVSDASSVQVSVLGPYEVNITWPPLPTSVGNLNVTVSPIVTIYFRDNSSVLWIEAVNITEGDSWAVVGALSPYTHYQFNVTWIPPPPPPPTVDVNDDTEHETDLLSSWIQTLAAEPNSPPYINMSSVLVTSRSVYFEYESPPDSTWNGPLTGFTLSYNSPALRDGWSSRVITNLTAMHINQTGLMPFQNYTFRLSAFNAAGDGPFAVFSICTDEEVPSAPFIRTVLKRNDTSLAVAIYPPQYPNGILHGYIFYYTYNGTVHPTNITTTGRELYQHHLTGLLPFTKYDLQVAAYNSKGEGPMSDVYPTMTDVAAPGAPDIQTLYSNQSDSLVLTWSGPVMFTLQVDQYIVVYQSTEDGKSYELKLNTGDIIVTKHEYLISGLKANTRYRVQVAAATRSIDTYNSYYFGPYSEAFEATTMAISSGMSSVVTGVVVGVLGTILVVTGFIIIIILIRRCMNNHYQFIGDQDPQLSVVKNVEGPGLVLSSLYDAHSCVHRDAINVSKFEEHVASLHADGDYMLSQEYEEINRQTSSSQLITASLLEDNKQKNRYLNILAYDHSRVVLKPVTGKPRHLDYINANYIDGYMKPKAYIATQGPMPSTFGDFWRMVWEQDSVVIVMITKLVEKGRRKCDQYWPNEGEQQYEGGYIVRLISTSVTAHYTVRTLGLRLSGKQHKKRCSSIVGSTRESTLPVERVIYQYHYTDWPDHGVPIYTLPTLTFVMKSAAANPSTAGPIIVHCSAGVGRTGTYIVLDSMMRQIKDIQTVNVFGFLSHIRSQRNYLVQTEDQYSFVHDALVEFIRSGGDTEIKDVNLSQYIKHLTLADEDGSTLLHRQYELVTSFELKPFHFQSACLTANESKNRSPSLLPVELARVHITPKAGVEGSDYINASFLQGYSRNDEYIVTQHPLESTTTDFWNMIYDQNSAIVVLLSTVDDAEFKVFWPLTDAMDCGNCQVAFQSQSADGPYSLTEFLLQSTQDDYECVVKMIACPSWPSAMSPLSCVFELLTKVRALLAEREQTQGPIIVVDRFGGVEAATFCALMTLHDALHHEASVDVYTVSKLYHMKRPSVIPTEDDYLFLYKAIESLCGDESSLLGDKDSGIANCNNYSVMANQPQSSIQPTTPSSPDHNNPNFILRSNSKTASPLHPSSPTNKQSFETNSSAVPSEAGPRSSSPPPDCAALSDSRPESPDLLLAKPPSSSTALNCDAEMTFSLNDPQQSATLQSPNTPTSSKTIEMSLSVA